MKEHKTNKAELSRQLGVSRAYITMIVNGTRKPSVDFVNKMENLGFTLSSNVNNFDSKGMTLNQPVRRSIRRWLSENESKKHLKHLQLKGLFGFS